MQHIYLMLMTQTTKQMTQMMKQMTQMMKMMMKNNKMAIDSHIGVGVLVVIVACMVFFERNTLLGIGVCFFGIVVCVFLVPHVVGDGWLLST